jgi:dihydrofolate reductase
LRSLTLSIIVTLDGCCDHREVIADDELHEFATGLLDTAGGVLFGRISYQLFEAAWPEIARTGSGPAAEVAFARRLDQVPKYVASRTLQEVRWPNSFIIRDLAGEVTRLKRADGNGLFALGSPGLGSALAQMDLVDEYQFVVQPTVAGHGPILFQGLDRRLNLRLVESRPFRSGAVLLRYTPAATKTV